ncbi:type VI secretion system Vgr family protein [Providencia sp. PROV152]|uniref:Type VI secretion system tip protein VgrG n=2 Tax=Providencia TaxID=586 RepID=A0AAI9I093_PROST|nr:type VI secretion system tip protein VgrG [Providencia sp. PROV152]ELR5036227.1 type VI secretion system tip protein VgrG [Providencia stuartii]
MSLMDTVKRTFQSHNRYHLKIQDCQFTLDVEHFIGREAISETYRYQITFTSPAQNLQAQQFLRRTAHFTFSSPTIPLTALNTLDEPQKHIHGVVTHFKRLSGSADEAQYQIVIEPFVSLLRHQMRSHRFFLNKSVPDVIDLILREHDMKGWEFEFHLQRQYPKREQINQINESDWQFIERLLSEVGIFYSFSLQPDTKTEVIHFGDSQRAYVYDLKLPLNSPSGMNDNGVESVWELSLCHQVVERSVTTKDYNHRQAMQTLQSIETDMTRGEGDDINYGDVYHYKPRHLERGEKYQPETETAHFWSRLDHERFLARQTLLRGKSNSPRLTPLMIFKVIDSQLPSTLPTDFQSEILITRLRFSGSRSSALVIQFDAAPYTEALCWRPTLKPRPVIAGTLMARITSAKSHDIYAHQNEHGFYWVKFDADRDEKPTGYESMPVRLAKPYAGDTYGMHFPLIQGTEVAVAFHEGDPDRPYIAHALHDSHRPDHITDKNNTRNVIRTPANNKLRMEDKRGEEHIKLSTEYGGKSQLNLGHLVNQGREKRGDGFELRTDSWGAIRAGKGLFISTDLRTKASSEQLDMREAKQQLDDALNLVSSLREAAEVAKAELADLNAQQTLLTQSIQELQQAALLLSAPAGIALTSPKTVQASSGENITLTAHKQADISVGKKITLAAGKAISLFAHTLGIKAFTAKGRVEIQAQSDEMHLTSLKDMTVTSTGGKTVVAAKDELLLTCGGAYIRLKGGQIEYGSPSNQMVKATNWVVEGPASMDVTHPQFPQSMPKQTLRFQLSASPQSAMMSRAFEPYTLYANGALLTQGVTDEHGNIQIEHDVSIAKYRVELMDGENFDIHLQPEKDEPDEEDVAQQGFRVIEPPLNMMDKSEAGLPHKSVFHRLLNPLLNPDDTTK